MITILVCGGRDFDNERQVNAVLEKIAADNADRVRIVHGGASGADTLAAKWAINGGHDFKSYPADWKKHGNAAGPVRNSEMLASERVHLIVAFPGGRGTADMVAKARRSNVPVILVEGVPV